MMSWSHLRTAGIVLVALVAFPGSTHAGIFDFIWELSGPEVFAYVTFACEIDLTKRPTPKEAIPKDLPRECRVYDIRIAGNAGFRVDRRLWLALGATAYTSTGKNSPSGRYAAFENNMIEFEPMLYGRYKPKGWFRQGIGLKHDRFYGKSFQSFDRFALQVVPVTAPIKPWRVEILPTVAFYQGRFAAGQFGAPPPQSPKKSKWEKVVIGFKLEYLPKRPKTDTVQATPKPGQ